MEVQSIDRPFLLRTAILSLLLLWPLLVFGQPSYFPDSASYQHGGKIAVDFAAKKLHLWEPTPTAKPASAPDAQSPAASSPAVAGKAATGGHEDLKVARSILYSVMGYVMGGPGTSMIFLGIFQAICLAIVSTALYGAITGPAYPGFELTAVILALFTTAAPVSWFIVPDIYAGLLIAVTVVIGFYGHRCSWALLLLLLGIAILSVAVHSSHPPIALAMAGVGGLWMLFMERPASRERWLRIGLLFSPFVLGVVLTILTGIIGFGEVSVAPKRYPLALARAINNGPAYWYLQKHCKKPEFAVCEVYRGQPIPREVRDFLWGPGGVILKATPEQMDRIRAEENTIILRSTMEHPWVQINKIIVDVPRQMRSFKVNGMRFDSTISVPDGREARVISKKNMPNHPIMTAVDMISTIIVLISTIALALWLRGMSVKQRGIFVTLFFGLLANAAICAIFSGVTHRYQARVIWVVPLFALALGYSDGRWRQVRALWHRRRTATVPGADSTFG